MCKYMCFQTHTKSNCKAQVIITAMMHNNSRTEALKEMKNCERWA